MQFDGIHEPIPSHKIIGANSQQRNQLQDSGSSSDQGFESEPSDQASPVLSFESDTESDLWQQNQHLRVDFLILTDTVKMIRMITVIHLIRYLGAESQKLGSLSEKTQQQLLLVDKIDEDGNSVQWLLNALQDEFQRQSIASSKSSSEQQSISSSSKTWQPCPQLRHYRQQNRQQQLVVLQFADRKFDAERYGPAGVPAHRVDMHSEANRLATFEQDRVESSSWSTAAGISGEVRQALARTGWFVYDPAGSLCCAFCYGKVDSTKARNSFANYVGGDETFWPMRLHQEQFGTCPLVLQLAVGNRRDCGQENSQTRLSAPVACSEDSGPDSATSWSQTASSLSASPSSQSEAMHQLHRRAGLPTASLAAAQAACNPKADSNLLLLERSLLNNPETAQTYHPQRHPGMSDRAAREANLTTAASVARANSMMSKEGKNEGKSAEIPLPAELLAEAGFFHLDGEGDCLACYWCGIRLRHWLPNDEPWIEHARWSPRCCHLMLERGADFVLASRKLHPPYLPDGVGCVTSAATYQEPSSQSTPTAAEVSQRSAPSVCIDYRVEPRQLRARDDTPAAALLRRLLDSGDAKTAMAEQLRRTGGDFASSQMLLSAGLDVHRRRRAQELSAEQYCEKRLAELDEMSLVDAKHLESDESMDWRACKVCMDRQINVTLMDCGHYCCCSNCSRSLTACPVCRAPIRAALLIRD